MINKLVAESQNNPIVIYTDQNVVHIQTLNFPAVSLCPGIIFKTPRKILIDYDLLLKNASHNNFDINSLEEHEIKLLQIASLINRDGFFRKHFKKFSIRNDDFMDKLYDFELPWYKSFSHYRNSTLNFFDAAWMKNFYASFTQTLWKGGFCYTFNFPRSDEIFYLAEMPKFFNYKVHTPGAEFKQYSIFNFTPPFKSPLPGSGLTIRYDERPFQIIELTDKQIETIKSNMYGNITYLKIDEWKPIPKYSYVYFNIPNSTIPKTSFGGHRFVIHDSYEVIPFNAKFLHSIPDSNLKILVTPIIKRIDESLKDENPEKRNCYLPNERKLKFLKVYNKINCEHECLANLTLKLCRCVQFFMVRNPNTRICGFKDEKCYLELESKFQYKKYSCKCYENCELVEYEGKVAYQEKNKIKKFDQHRQIDTKIIVEMSIEIVLAVKTRQATTTIDLLSLSGGFLGLFAGFSVLSAAEIIYYFLIHPVIDFQISNSTRVYPMSEEIKNDTGISKFFKEILQESSIHSFNHIGNEKKHIVERIVWVILFIGSMTCTYFMVIEVYNMTSTDVVSISMEGSATNVEEIPFPAVTIQGSLGKSLAGTAFDVINLYKFVYLKTQDRYSIDEIRDSILNADFEILQILALVCADSVAEVVENIDSKINSFVAGYRKWMNDSSQVRWFDDQCVKWNNKENPEFAEIVTKFGFSYTFNMIESSQLLNPNVSDEFYYKYNKSMNYPWKTSAGEKKGLSVFYYSRTHTFECVKPSFALHSPFEFPNENDFVHVDDKHEYFVNIIPTITKADDSLRSLSIDSRKCYFDGERQLRFFKVYTQKNCEFECLAMAMHKKCHCVPFYYVRDKFWEVCDYRRMKFCIEKFKFQRSIRKSKIKDDCNCLSNCNSVSYAFEVTENRLEERSFKIETENNKIFILKQTSLEFQYMDSEYFAYFRYQQFKIVDFLSYVGGILGLFAGISVLSFVEILYFVTLRFITDLKRHYYS